MRDYIDALDGSIHRERQHSHSQGHVVSPSSLGYAVDGICDGLSDFFRLLAFVIVLQRYHSNNNTRWARKILKIRIKWKNCNFGTDFDFFGILGVKF